MTTREAGHTFIELAVGLALFGLLLLIMMPSFQGYQTNAQIRETGATVVAEIRTAEVQALSLDETLEWWACYDCSPAYFKVTVPGSGAAIAYTVLQQSTGQLWHVTGTCYRGPIAPGGTVNVATPPCAAPAGATFELVCFDSNTRSNPYGIKITVVIATGQVLSTTVGTCQ